LRPRGDCREERKIWVGWQLRQTYRKRASSGPLFLTLPDADSAAVARRAVAGVIRAPPPGSCSEFSPGRAPRIAMGLPHRCELAAGPPSLFRNAHSRPPVGSAGRCSAARRMAGRPSDAQVRLAGPGWSGVRLCAHGARECTQCRPGAGHWSQKRDREAEARTFRDRARPENDGATHSRLEDLRLDWIHRGLSKRSL
jgi:hypothetical protein